MNDLFTLIASGLTAGEAASPSNAEYRVHALPPRRARRRHELAMLADDEGQTSAPRPFAHADSPARLHPGAGENVEWFVFSASMHKRAKEEGSSALLIDWTKLALAPSDTFARAGTKIALENLRRGKTPPAGGHDNPHYFDDIAMIRALGAVITYETDIDSLTRAIIEDSSFTHSLDGVWCATATGILFSSLIGGASVKDAIAVSLEQLPLTSWSRRVAEDALRVAGTSANVMERARLLSIEVGDWIYSYPIAAPETFAFLVAHLAHAQSASELILGAMQGRNWASLPALAGAAAAVVYGDEWVPSDLDPSSIRLTGLSIPKYRDKTVAEAVALDA